MKQAINNSTGAVDSTVVSNAIRTSYSIDAIPRLRADWNLNRYVIPVANNIPAEDVRAYDKDIFPAKSLIEPVRPNKGAPKAIIGQATIAPNYGNSLDPRFYVADDEDIYKYWISPDRTDGTGVFPTHTDGQTTCRPYVAYPKVMKANKIVLRFENTWATPNSYKVRIRSTVLGAGDPTAGWTQIATNTALANDGTVTYYYNGSSWVTTRPANNPTTNVAGIQLAIDSLKAGVKRDGSAMTYMQRSSSTGPLTEVVTDGSNSNCSVIAIEAHFETNLTDRLQSVNDTFDMGDVDQLYPVGTITTNVGGITLDNGDSIFNNENTSSPYFGLMEPNVEFTLDYIYTVGGVGYTVNQFKMYGGAWSGQYADDIDIDLEDSSKFLKLVKPRPTMYENKTIPELVWRVLDSVGFSDYEIDQSDLATEHTIPVFWTDGEMTAWEVLDDLARATQTAIYFTGNNKLQVKTREAAFNDAKTPSWVLYGQKVGNNLPDISELEADYDFEANNIDVKYRNSKWRVGDYGDPALAKVWEPEDETLVVRSAPLYRALGTSGNAFWLPANQIAVWPYKSKVNIDGEILEYEGKEFVYYTYTETKDSNNVVTYSNPVKHYQKVISDDEKNSYNAKTPREFQSKNYLTGAVYITQRGMWNTVAASHPVDASGWTTMSERIRNDSGTRVSPVAIMKHNPTTSTITMTGGYYQRDAADTAWVQRGVVADTPYRQMGTRLRIRADASHMTMRAGMAFYLNGTRNNGYYVEVRTTGSITTKDADNTAEVMIYSKKNGKYATVALGGRVSFIRDRWADVDVYITPGTNDRIQVWFNGQRVAEGVTNSQTKQPTSGKYAMYTRGKTIADFEYFYGFSRLVQPEPADDFGVYDLVYGGMRSNYFQREAVYQLKTRVQKINKKNVTVNYKLNDYIFDEFGPYVHEIREFDVKFEPSPVQYSSLFSTNNWYTGILDYLSTPFGAKFKIANISRKNAILHGEDALVFNSAESTVNQVCTVLGRDLDIADEEVVNVKNEGAIRARGQIDTELSSQWLQTKDMAEAVSTWIAKHWSEGLDSLTVTIFGNPLIEIGDIVSIDYAEKNMTTATHNYFVTGASSSYEDGGIDTTLTLRRVRTAPDEDLTTTP